MSNSRYTYRIHPAIGFARVGDAPESYYLEPTGVGALPTEYDANGEEVPVRQFKEAGQIRRQAARFRIYRYEDGKNPVEVRLGRDLGLKSLKWTVHMANKKSAWWNFSELQGDVMIGPEDTDLRQSKYWKGPSLRNATAADRSSLVTTQSASGATIAGVNAASQNVFPIQWLIGI